MTPQRIYAALLSLYPRSFRTRFGPEMIQLFKDCYPDARPLLFWMETLRDFALSVPREWRREIQWGRTAIDSTIVLDAIMVASVVGPLLLWWGWITTAVLFDLGPQTQDILSWSRPGILFMTLATLAMACLVGILSATAAARTGRIDTKSYALLASYEKPTPPLIS